MLIQKMFWKLLGKAINNISVSKYMKMYVGYLRKCGLIINGNPNYISPDAYFDIQPFAKITIDDSVVISKEVMILTHDFSIARGVQAIGGKNWNSSKTPHILKTVSIGENSFIGARAFLLPGTQIGKNCIVGGGAVVRGIIPDNSVVIGNPAKIVANTDEWTKRQIEKGNVLV